MTSINALRLNFHSGLMVCDEARYWNPDWMIFYTPEKIRSVVRPDIREHSDVIMFMGQTGTSSIGDEFIDRVEKKISRLYDDETKRLGKPPRKFRTVEQLAGVAFEVCTSIKHTHVDDFLQGKYGFNTREFISGSYQRADRKYEIKDEKILDAAGKCLTWEDQSKDLSGIFGNSQLLAGYDPSGGFRLFYQTERTPVLEEVQECFTAWGSARDTCDLQFCEFANTRTITERRGDVDRVEGLVALLKGLNVAFRLTAGVGGYPKIIYVNAKEKDWSRKVVEISDCRSKLAMEIVLAGMHEFLPEAKVRELVDRIIFKGVPFAEVDKEFFDAVTDAEGLMRFFRGYPRRAS
jgi:hypothetical protein